MSSEKSPISFDELLDASKVRKIPEIQFHVSSEDTKLAFYHFKTDRDPVATIIVLHGGGAHSLAGYEHIAELVKEKYNISCYLFDLRGHGKSEGKRGDAPKIKTIWKDLKSFIDFVKSKSKIVYLCGHSSGAGLLLNYISWNEKSDVDGYFFISPQLGYKSKTEKTNLSPPFASIKLYKFVVSAMTGGLLFGNSMAVFFNYPKKIIESDKLLLSSITRNMSMAMTPYAPKKQFMSIDKSYGLFIGENDELFKVEKVVEYCTLTDEKVKKKSVCEIIKNRNHLSILLDIGRKIGETVSSWQK